MALLFVDGFDHLASGSTGFSTKWGAASSPALNPPARTGTGAVHILAGAFIETRIFAVSTGFVVGVALRWEGNGGVTTGNAIEIREGTTVHLAVGMAADRRLVVRRGTTDLATASTGPLSALSYYYVEFKGTIHDTTGSYELRVDGVTAASASGVDTRNAGTTGQWDRVRFAGFTASPNFNHFDDVYICDQSGTRNNDFLGICRVETLLPSLGNGSNVGLTPSTGTDHGALVDEVPPNATDFNSSPTVGAKDTYHYPNTTLSGVILGVQTNLYCNKSDTAARTVCAVVRTGGADYDGANVSPTTTFSYLWEVRALNPSTGVAWTSADINALEVGMKVTA